MLPSRELATAFPSFWPHLASNGGGEKSSQPSDTSICQNEGVAAVTSSTPFTSPHRGVGHCGNSTAQHSPGGDP